MTGTGQVGSAARRPSLSSLLIGLGLIIFAASGCGAEEKETDDPVVATVGPIAITASEFERSYEFGFNINKRGENRRRAYLERMIEEALLAAEGYKAGLDQSEDIQRRSESLREELLVEQVFERKVNDHVTVSDEEILEAMQQDRVSFKLRYLLAPSRAEGERIRAGVEANGFDDTLDRLIAGDIERAWNRDDFESPYLTAHDLDPYLLDAISDLPAGELSEPIPYRGSYILIEVMDIRREPLPPQTDPAEHTRYEQIVFQQKAKAAAREFIAATMGPAQVEVKSQPYLALQSELWAWYREHPPVANLREAIDASDDAAARRLRELYDQTLITSTEGEWTVGAFLRDYPVDRYPLSTRRESELQRDLYDAVGLMLRDRAFVRIARDEGYASDPPLQRELEAWRNKWVQRAMLSHVLDTMAVSDAEARAHYDAYPRQYLSGDDQEVAPFDEVRDQVVMDVRAQRLRSRRADLLAGLRARHAVHINEEVLDTLAVSDDAASPDVLVFKGHTGRIAFPVVDPLW